MTFIKTLWEFLIEWSEEIHKHRCKNNIHQMY